MTRGRVIGILVASVLAYAAVGTRVAFGQSGFGLSGLNVSVPGVAVAGIGISSTSVGLGGGGAAVSLPGVSVSNVAAVTTSSVSLGGGSAAVALPGVSVTGVASVSQTTVNLSGGVATVGLPDVNLAGVSLTTTQLTLNLTGDGNLLALPGVTLAVPGLPPVTLPGSGDGGLGDILEVFNQVSPVTEAFASMSSMATIAPMEQMLNGFAFADPSSPDCAQTGPAGLAPLPVANVWMWGSNTVGTTEHDGYQLERGDGADCGTRLAFKALEKTSLPGILWDASSAFGLKSGTLHLGFTGGITDTETQIRAGGAWLDAGIARAGAARLTSTSVGSFSLLTAGNWYAGSAVGSAWGRNESQNFLLGSSSDYDTSSFVATGIVGTILPVADNIRFDIRGTLAYQRTAADAHVDTLGIAYGDHTIETTDATMSGRLFGVYRHNDVTIRPYLQAGITHRLDYDNELRIDGVTFTYDEADTSVFAATGLDFEISRTLQLSAGVRQEQSRDYDDLIARFGVLLRLN